MAEPANATASDAKVLLACRRTPAPVDVAAFVGPEPDPVLVWVPVGLYKAFRSVVGAQRYRGLGTYRSRIRDCSWCLGGGEVVPDGRRRGA